MNRVVIGLTCAALLILLGIPQARREFINPGPLSTAHSSPKFALPHGGTNDQSCRACHVSGNSGPNGILTTALNSEPRPWQLAELLKMEMGAPTSMDDACQKCHAGRAFHQVNTAREVSCAFCHPEHRGLSRLAVSTDAHCGLCHANQKVMAASASKGAMGSVQNGNFPSAHPAEGLTQVIHGFASDHPEFRAVISKLPDPNTLKFNHQLHLTGATIPALPNGQKLDCAFCHQPDASQTFMRTVQFENHCRVCHSLQIDPETPELTLPHGDVDHVSAFLHSLPQQYSELARRLGITDTAERKQFTERKLAALRKQLQSGEDFERRVFFNSALSGPGAKVGAIEGAARTVYPGCAYCHEVKSDDLQKVKITKPVFVERWFIHAKFEHANHSSMACYHCHPAEKSNNTADVLLPSKIICVACHSPQGGAVDSCSTCHAYHKTSNSRSKSSNLIIPARSASAE
ncbi:MAG: hypothetical protein H7Y43_11750 [Akkermansiaceae bacterium]|nr:hypothetical protein [Verrucomicrobiales bacterium]